MHWLKCGLGKKCLLINGAFKNIRDNNFNRENDNHSFACSSVLLYRIEGFTDCHSLHAVICTAVMWASTPLYSWFSQLPVNPRVDVGNSVLFMAKESQMIDMTYQKINRYLNDV